MTGRAVNESVWIGRSPAEVFDAWTSGDALAEWFAPMAVRPPDVEMEFRVGGAFRIAMDVGPGGVHVTEGRFLEIIGNELIRMTWRCDAWADPPSEVEVTFTGRDTGTLVSVRHTLITSDPAQEGQAFGWVQCLGNLKAYLLDG